MSPRCEGLGGPEKGPGPEQAETQNIQVKQDSLLLATPSPAHGECSECDVLMRSGLPLHLEHWVGGSATFTYPRGFSWGLRKFSIDIA